MGKPFNSVWLQEAGRDEVILQSKQSWLNNAMKLPVPNNGQRSSSVCIYRVEG